MACHYNKSTELNLKKGLNNKILKFVAAVLTLTVLVLSGRPFSIALTRR